MVSIENNNFEVVCTSQRHFWHRSVVTQDKITKEAEGNEHPPLHKTARVEQETQSVLEKKDHATVNTI